ncbi:MULTISPECIES: hypothetical protein [Streptomyces]|uniref:Uncharacterized protein n=2 Tax=Streptomyces TaxID=1883 RepID=A0A100Y9D6_9ACTN|nr:MULTISPECIES: hypothetical protein [Streptomyces]KUH40016.1 hypothetical protein ATE80_04315 [Streptomyces kanasensis]UUS29578.1 hypothetical protein NRO40_01160 [Streptomyces changanensis]
MGYDTSFHPVDLRLIEERLLPYLAGLGEDDAIDDLVAQAVETRKVRFRAKAWALGLLAHARDRDDLPFDSHLHVWGRPFLIVGDGPERIAEDIRRYLATPVEGVDALASEMVGRLDPALRDRVRPDEGGRLPADDVLAESLVGPLRVLRGAARALRAGERTVRRPGDGRELDAAALVTREVPFNVLDFAAALLPGWMSRGHTWPTRLCADAGVPAEGFEAPTALTGLLRERFPALEWPPAPASITGNYTVGALVPASAVPGARSRLLTHRDRLDCEKRELRKIDEAMGVAEVFGVAFCEATEIYSGLEGNLN